MFHARGAASAAALPGHQRSPQQGQLPFLVQFRYLAEGIRIHGQWYPVVKMPWIQGFTLNQFVRDNLDKPALLDRLAKMWVRLAQQLRASVRHADLATRQRDLVPTRDPAVSVCALIDYDGMYVPSLARSPSGEVGKSNYQHRNGCARPSNNSEIDRFSHLVIYTALRCLALRAAGRCGNAFDNSENLLFREQDFASRGIGPVTRLWRTQKTATRTLVGHLLLATQGSLTACRCSTTSSTMAWTEPLTAETEPIGAATAQRGCAPVAVATPVQPTPVTPAMLMELRRACLVDVFDTVAGPPLSAKPRQTRPGGHPRGAARPPYSRGAGARQIRQRSGPPPLPRRTPRAGSTGRGLEEIAGALAGRGRRHRRWGCRSLIVISVIVLFTMRPARTGRTVRHSQRMPRHKRSAVTNSPIYLFVDGRTGHAAATNNSAVRPRRKRSDDRPAVFSHASACSGPSFGLSGPPAGSCRSAC